MQEYFPHGILLPNATFISELTDTTPATNSEELVGYAAGHVHPLFRGIRNQQPDLSFDCPAVGQVLAAIIAGGNRYCLDLSAGNTDIGYRQGQNLGMRYGPGESYHEILRMTRGFMFWNTIGAQQDQEASIGSRIIATYDGTNAPVAQVGTGALSGTPAAVQWYTLGPVQVNGVAVAGLQEWSLESGDDVSQKGDQGAVWRTYASVRQLNQVLTLKAEGKPWGNYGLTGAAITSLTWYLRAKAVDGANAADGTPSHIKFVATNGLVMPEDVSGGEDSAVSSLRIGLRAANGSSDVLAITVGSAIT